MLQSAYWFKLVHQIVTEHPHKKLQPQGYHNMWLHSKWQRVRVFGTFLELGVR